MKLVRVKGCHDCPFHSRDSLAATGCAAGTYDSPTSKDLDEHWLQDTAPDSCPLRVANRLVVLEGSGAR